MRLLSVAPYLRGVAPVDALLHRPETRVISPIRKGFPLPSTPFSTPDFFYSGHFLPFRRVLVVVVVVVVAAARNLKGEFVKRIIICVFQKFEGERNCLYWKIILANFEILELEGFEE